MLLKKNCKTIATAQTKYNAIIFPFGRKDKKISLSYIITKASLIRLPFNIF